MLRARDDAPAELAGRLWDLPGWSRTATRLLEDMAAAPDTAGRFIAAAGMVRHLLTDPVLPDELLPAGWPGAAMRQSYARFALEMAVRRESTELVEAK
jgi:phenylacetic acid degradation operon negative regulatory protein